MPIPFQQAEGLIYNVYDRLPFSVGFSRVFNNGVTTIEKFKALNLDADGVRYADATAGLMCHGFAWNDINPNEWGYMATDTSLYLQDWFLLTNPQEQYLRQGFIYYLADNGNISYQPSATGLVQEIGLAISIGELSVEIQSIGVGGGGSLGPIIADIAAIQAKLLALDADDDDRADRVDEEREMLAVLSLGQTVFTLGRMPLEPSYAEVLVNGQQLIYGTDFIIAGTTLTYIGSYLLSPTDNIQIIYR